MYITEPEFSNSHELTSTIRVIDISNSSGSLVEGAQIHVAGSVNSRWQMDEYESVLRVVSQPIGSTITGKARIETFKINSAQSIEKIAEVEMVIPLNEDLRSVRFDGDRAYAITTEQQTGDPLYTIDLSDPTQPRQVGALEMPGWIYHMEPRGNRIAALGLDSGNANGELTISLFDVSDLNTPKMLDRVNFGGDWAWNFEDQNRVQKAFQVLDANNLILMPFSGYVHDDESCRGLDYINGIQLVDWTGDTLNLRGVARLEGQSRRGFLHDERLFSISDERVEMFDISNRMEPLKRDSLKTAHVVHSTVAAGKTILKVVEDLQSYTVSLDTTTLDQVEVPQQLGHIDFSPNNSSCSRPTLGTIAVSNNRAYLLIDSTDFTSTSNLKHTSRLVTLDVTSANSPKILGDVALDFGESWSYWNNDILVNAGASSVAVGNTFSMLSTRWVFDEQTKTSKLETTVHVLDVTDPSEPKDTKYSVDSDYETTGLFVSESTVALGYFKPSPVNSNHVRFYMERIDVSEPSTPKRYSSVNVPGAIIAFDASSSNVVTASEKRIEKFNLTSQECDEKYVFYSFGHDNNITANSGIDTCSMIQQSVSLVNIANDSARVLGAKTLEAGRRTWQVAVGSDRVFLTLPSFADYDFANHEYRDTVVKLLVMGGLHSGDYALGELQLSGGDYWDSAPMAASGTRAVLATGWQGKLVVVDGSDPKAPVMVRQVELAGNASQLTTTAGVGIASLNNNGVQAIPLFE